MIANSLKWSRYNLFGKPFDALLSLTVIPGVLWLIWQIVRWALTVAHGISFRGASACS